MPRGFHALALFLVSLLAACSLAGGPRDGPRIRVENRSAVDFDAVLVRFDGHDEEYGPLAAGAASDYRPVERAYRYAYVAVRVDTARLVLQPIDFVGESLLDEGRYTYVLSLSESGRDLALRLERD